MGTYVCVYKNMRMLSAYVSEEVHMYWNVTIKQTGDVDDVENAQTATVL